MRIGVNLVPLRPGQMGGAEVYFRDLLAELAGRGDHEYVLVTADYNHDTLPADTAACRRVLFAPEGRPASRPLRRLAGRARGGLARGLRWLGRQHRQRRADSLRELIGRERIDLWFCPFTNLDPRVSPVPAVITVYDLQHEHYPEFFDAAELRHRRAFYPESCAGADQVIAISEYTRRDIVDRYGAEPGRVTAIWLAAGSDFAWRAAAARAPEVRARYGLPRRYAFYPANTWHHKNHARLIEALARHRRQRGDDLALVLTGVGKEGQPRLRAAVDREGLGDAVRLLGFVPRDDLPGLYAAASCLVFPSLFEGFGIPLVEAMLAGCPIAAADATSIPEVVGDAAVLFDPRDPADIARGLAAVACDEAAAAALVRRGRERAARFSVRGSADRTLEVFERARGAGPGRGRAGGRERIAVEGVFDDRWMGRDAMLSLDGAALTSLEIEGLLPGIAPLVPQRLRIAVGGRPAADLALTSPGPFAVSVPLPQGGGTGRFYVSLVPERTFCPREHGLSADGRELSVQLVRLCARTGDGRAIVKTLGGAPDPDEQA